MEGGLTAGTEIHPSQEQSSKRKRGRAATATDSTDPSAVKPTRKRSRRASGDQSHGDEDSAAEGSKRKRKPRDPNTPRKSRKRVPSPPPFDPSVEPGEELDPTVVTMSALCEDSGQGRVSSKAAQIVSNHAAWRAANREKRTRLKAIIEAKKYGRNPDDEEQPASGANRDATANPEQTHADHVESEEPVGGPSTRTDNRPAHEPRGDDNFDYSNDFSTSRYNVQVRIGANGETIIDEESLFVSRNEEDETENYTHVEESDTTKFVNSQSYSKKARGSRWSAEETELFYDALSQFGENYELISYILPGRDRKACKNKFKAEDKKSPARITYCLTNRRPFDIATLSRMTGKDFSGPTPVIRAPTPLRSSQLDTGQPTETPDSPAAVRKQSRTPGPSDYAEEVLGNIDDESMAFEDVVVEA